jgi:Cu/Ag efflux protein CusF
MSRIILAGTTAIAVTSGAWAQQYETTGRIMKIDQAQGKITLEHKQGGVSTPNPKPLVDEYKMGESLKAAEFKSGDQVTYTEALVGGVWTVTKMQKSE